MLKAMLDRVYCPKCHAKLQLATVIPSIHYAYFHCQNPNCAVRQVCIDIRDCQVLNVEYFRSKDAKRKIIAEALRRNYKKYSPRVRRRLKYKYKKLVGGE